MLTNNSKLKIWGKFCNSKTFPYLCIVNLVNQLKQITMQEFKFNVDIKMVTWERNTLSVKAENLEEARRKLLTIDPDVFAGCDDLPEDMELESTMVLTEANEYYPTDGKLTYEIFDETTNETIFAKP